MFRLLDERSWTEHAKLAKNYKALDSTDIYLFGSAEKPWHLVTGVKTGGGHRLGIPVSFDFSAQDGKSGLSFRWSFDLEQKNANGQSKFVIDTLRIREVVKLLSPSVAKHFRSLLSETAKAIRAKAEEYQAVANDQYGVAVQLETL